MNCDCNQGRLACSCAPDLEGSAAQKAYWAGFEAATLRPGQSNIRAAWNDYRLTDEFKRISQPRCEVVLPERTLIAGHLTAEQSYRASGRNACLDEVARLNPPGECVAVDERAEFEAWFTDHAKDWPFPSESIKSIARSNDWLVWQARALLAQQGKESV